MVVSSFVREKRDYHYQTLSHLPNPPEGRTLNMPHGQKNLHQIAKEKLWHMFTGEEIAEICNVSQNVISRVKSLSDSPFFLNKCRPEWFSDWMRHHPRFQLTKALPSSFESPSLDPKRPASSPPTHKLVRRRKPSPKPRANRKP
jgi:hypothetical protein